MSDNLARTYADNRTCFKFQRSPIALVAPLAAGADSLVAVVALMSGEAFVACLPFDAATYREDFAGENLERFDRLLGAARRAAFVRFAVHGIT